MYYKSNIIYIYEKNAIYLEKVYCIIFNPENILIRITGSGFEFCSHSLHENN
jgi:hypothetical protein